MSEIAPTDVKPEISFEDFSKLDLRVATVTAAETHPNADRLLLIQLDSPWMLRFHGTSHAPRVRRGILRRAHCQR